METFGLEPNDGVPNNPEHPARLYRAALAPKGDDGVVRAHLESHGWTGSWTWQVFDYHHFHPNAWEVLAVASGKATLMIGGPKGREVAVAEGDAILLPPGTGHCQVEASSDFRICGAYPPGQTDYDTIRAETGFDEQVTERIAAVPLPKTDPVTGSNFGTATSETFSAD